MLHLSPRHKRAIRFCILLFSFCPQAHSLETQLPPLIPREALFGNPVKTGAAISPDGRMLGYLAPHEGTLNVWIRTLGQEDDRVVTADKRRGIRWFTFQYDSKHILYIQDLDGDENWHIFQTDLETKNTRDLTPFQGVRAKIVALDPNFPDELLAALNIRDRRLHDVYRINLKNGAVDLDTENPGNVADWAVDNGYHVRAARVFLPDGGSELHVRDTAKSPWRTFQRWGADETFGSSIVGFSQDNSGLLSISSVGANTARLIHSDLATGDSTVISEDKRYDAGSVLIHPKKHTVEAVQFVRERSEWVLVDKLLQSDFDALRNTCDGDFGIASRNLEDTLWIVAYDLDNAPLTYYLFDRATKKATRLFSNQPALEKHQLAKCQPISFKARDNMTIYGYLTLPVGVPSVNLPTVLNVHGGPWSRDTWGLDYEAQWLANRGYAVLQINFRGSTGYGKAYLNAGDREWAGKMHADLIDGKKWAAQQGYADPQRVAIYGGSYGGYATLVGLSFTPDEFACGVDLFGPSNLPTLIRSIPPYWVTLKSVFDKRLGKVEAEEEYLKARSPVFKADQIKKPLFIAQGTNDPRVKQAESDQIVAALRAVSLPVAYVVYTDEGHGFARPENRLDFYGRAEEFLAKHLGGRAEQCRPVKGTSAEVR